MGRRVSEHAVVEPASRRGELAQAEFFPGEAARLLNLEGVDYDTLRRLFSLARTCRGLDDPRGQQRGWSRFDLADLARAEALVRISGGPGAFGPGRRVAWRGIAEACEVLREAGLNDPLLQVTMFRVGRRVIARLDGLLLEPATGQLLHEALMAETDAPSDLGREALRTEVRKLRRRRRASRSQQKGALRRVVGY